MTDYSKLDAAILAYVAGERRYMHPRDDAEVHRKSREVAGCDSDHAYSAVDRRLQSLRKAGKITYSSKTGWTLVQPQKQPA